MGQLLLLNFGEWINNKIEHEEIDKKKNEAEKNTKSSSRQVNRAPLRNTTKSKPAKSFKQMTGSEYMSWLNSAGKVAI